MKVSSATSTVQKWVGHENIAVQRIETIIRGLNPNVVTGYGAGHGAKRTPKFNQ
ncbi:TPA: hypothetical protein QCX97_005156 [Bacillus wiedmannii]|nr:hypothetical protein [Bacillus wiedmannii]HDR7671185.1 hypothetical protein [Bacillus wiedmannii]